MNKEIALDLLADARFYQDELDLSTTLYYLALERGYSEVEANQAVAFCQEAVSQQ